MTNKTNRLIEEQTKIPYEGFYYLIVPDAAAGKKGRYSVYRIPSSPSRRIKVVGRELSLSNARQVVEKLGGGGLVHSLNVGY